MPFEMEDPDGDEPEPRKRFSGPRRSWWRPAGTLGRILLGLGTFAVLAGIAIGYQTARTFLTRDARFRIEGTANIQAAGLGTVSRGEILPIFGEDIGRNIFFVPLGERRRQIEQLPWVQSATVMRLWPDQIRVDVVERQPVAFVRQGGQIGLVDANGVLLTMPAAAMAQHHYSFPVLTGIDAKDSPASRKQRIELYERLMSELDASGQHNSSQISEIDLTDPEDARVTMQEQGTDIQAHLGEDHFLERYQRYKKYIAEWRQQYPKLAGVDLRYEQKVVLQMTPGAAEEAAASASGAKPDEAAAKPAETKPVETAKHDAPKHGAESKAASAKTAKSKAAGAKQAKANAHRAKSAAQQAHEERVKKIALEQRKRAETRRAAEKKSKQKNASKPQTPASAGQGQ